MFKPDKHVFNKRQHVTMLMTQTAPQGYDEAKQRFIELAKAREAARVAELKLEERIGRI